MAVPGYQEFMLPLLRIASDGREHRTVLAMETLASELGISEQDRAALLPSGLQTQFYNRVTWAITYLTKSLLLDRLGRGQFRITSRGLEALKANPSRVDNRFLEQYAEYRQFKTKRAEKAATTKQSQTIDVPVLTSETTPEEQLEAAHLELREALSDDLQKRMRDGSPKFFEHLVIQLLVAMDYGGGHVDRAKVTGKSGDDGIDGVISEDRLGLDTVYVQAKKWDSSVGPGEIDEFVGSLMRKRAMKGVFITSGAFTDGAVRAAKEAQVRVRLIDGDELANLMIDFNVGVAIAKSFVVKKIDGDFFEDLI